MKDALKPLRILRVAMITLLLALIVMVMAKVRFIFLAPVFIVWVFGSVIALLWPCPACGNALSLKTSNPGFKLHPFSDKCLHCGLRIKDHNK